MSYRLGEIHLPCFFFACLDVIFHNDNQEGNRVIRKYHCPDKPTFLVCNISHFTTVQEDRKTKQQVMSSAALQNLEDSENNYT